MFVLFRCSRVRAALYALTAHLALAACPLAAQTAPNSTIAPVGPGATNAPTLIRVGYAVAQNSHGTGVDAFARELSELTNGRFKVEHLAGGKAGGELEILNKVKSGELEMGNTSTGPLGNIVPEAKLFDLPFLFGDYAHARRTLDGPIGKSILDLLPKYGLIGLAWSENGFRHITNNKRAIVYPADLANLKLRTMENSAHMEAMRSLKVQPLPLAFNKLFAALKEGELDGQENPLPVILASKFNETQKYLSLTQHFYSPCVLVVSPKIWATLSAQDRFAFQTAAKSAVRAQRERVNTDEFAALTALRAGGMQINTYVDSIAFRNALRPQYENMLPGINPKIIDDIRKQR
jgi:TRAP-type transport system periplasmic protein